MSKKLIQVAITAGLLAVTALAAPVSAQSQDPPRPATEDEQSDYCSEASRNHRREMARTDGDTQPALETEAECRKQFFWMQTQS